MCGCNVTVVAMSQYGGDRGAPELPSVRGQPAAQGKEDGHRRRASIVARQELQFSLPRSVWYSLMSVAGSPGSLATRFT
jgi:hypothetical protein